jgi:hypothetical protein
VLDIFDLTSDAFNVFPRRYVFTFFLDVAADKSGYKSSEDVNDKRKAATIIPVIHSADCGAMALRTATTKSLQDRAYRSVDLISDVLPFGRLWYGEPDNAIGYRMHIGHHMVL